MGLIVLLGLPPFALFASELAIARSLADAGLSWALGAAMLLIVIAFAALARNGGRILLGQPSTGAPAIPVPATVADRAGRRPRRLAGPRCHRRAADGPAHQAAAIHVGGAS